MIELNDLVNQSHGCQAEINGKWVPRRPINYRFRSLYERARDAWLVLIGKADALMWPEGQ